MIIGRLMFCLILFSRYIGGICREKYRTDQWKVEFFSLWSYLKVCIPRCLGRICTLLVWSVTTYFIIIKGKDHLSILSIGSSLILLCSFFSESIMQSMTLIVSRYLGARNYPKLWKSYRIGFLFTFVFCGILAIPFLLFPRFVLSFFFLEVPTGFLGQQLELTIYWIWIWILCSNISTQLIAFLIAKRDMLFYMSIMLLTWVTSCLPVYICFHHLAWPPSAFWLILIADQCIVSIIYGWRIYQLKVAEVEKELVNSG
ncbi:MAG: hypothetical protein HYZ47_01320 [Simkania negevensis]|nr:hypothetical protein [Simkania negevensis]